MKSEINEDHLNIMGQIQVEAIRNWKKESLGDLNYFLENEKLVYSNKMLQAIDRLPIVPLAFFSWSPKSLKRISIAKSRHSFDRVWRYHAHKLKILAKTVAVRILKNWDRIVLRTRRGHA